MRGYRPHACAAVQPLQRARPRRRLHGERARARRRPALGGRAGLRRRQHEPLDHEAGLRRRPPRARRPGVLPADDARRLGAQHAGRELPVALLLRALGRQPRAPGAARVLLQPAPSGRVLRPRASRRRGLAGRRDALRHGQQLRHAAHDRYLRARARQAPGADALPAEERPLPHRRQRRRRTMNERLHAAVSAEERYRALLRSVVEVARAIFGAQASSVLLLDEEADELVFEAVAGQGSDLVGRRFPSSTGIAGWVLVTRQPLVIEDVGTDPRFARDTAESTGYVPKSLMAVPLLHEERALGVLEVLDRPSDVRFTLEEMELLGLFAAQAAVALDLLQRARR